LDENNVAYTEARLMKNYVLTRSWIVRLKKRSLNDSLVDKIILC